MIETYRGAVAAWDCDAFGHMNIAHYPDRFAAAAANLLGEGWRTIALDTQYLSELRAAAGMVIRSGVLAADDGAALVAHEAVNIAGERTTLAEHRLVRAGGAPAHAPAFAWERFPAPAWPEGDGVIPSGRDRARGVGSLSFYVHRFSDACLFAIEALGMSEAYRRERNRGFATFETRLLLEHPAPAEGEGLVVTSAIAAIGGSSLRIVHRMRAADGGRILARFFQAGVHFDLAARRAAPWPPGFRDRAASLGFAAH
jgi:acyl-CoA thioester hydrolase